MIRYLSGLLAVACGLLIGAHKLSGAEPVSYRQAAALSLAERRTLNQKAERGDDKAAFALALYYAAVAPNIKNREYFLILASKSGSRESIEALADFYSMPGGVFRLQKAISLRKELKSRFPNDVDNIDWAEGCAFEYHYLTTAEARRKELAFLKLAASWGSLKAKNALQTIRIDKAPPIAAARSKRKQPLPVAETNDFLRIPTDRITVLRKKARRGDPDAAERLGLYYGIYRNDKKRALRHLTLAAEKNSDVAIRNLITTYSTDPDFFNFKKALRFREKLKRIAETKKINVQPDADWSYDLYLEHFLAGGNKSRGIFFLKYATKQGSEQARNELVEIYANDSDFRNLEKARYWKRSHTSRIFAGVTAGFELLDPVVEPGTPLTVRLTLKNNSASETEFRYLNASFIEHIRLYDAKNQRVSFRVDAPFAESGAASITLGAGEAVTTIVSLDLWRYYDLQPGKYFLEFTYDLRLVSDPALATQYKKRYQSEDLVLWDTKKYPFTVSGDQMDIAHQSE